MPSQSHAFYLYYMWTGGDSTLSLAHGLPTDKQRAVRSGFPAQDLLGRPSAMVQIPRGFVPPATCLLPSSHHCQLCCDSLGSTPVDHNLCCCLHSLSASASSRADGWCITRSASSSSNCPSEFLVTTRSLYEIHLRDQFS